MAQSTGSAREQARRLQQQQERRQKTQSLLLRVGVVVLALVVVVGLTIWVMTRGGGGNYTEGEAPAAANEQGGIVLTSSSELAEGDNLGQIDAEDPGEAETVGAGDLPPGVEPREEGEPPHVIIYTDAGCPHCGQLESAYHSMFAEWLDAGAITLEYRSLSFVAPPYSQRTANAFACMAEEAPEHYQSYLGTVTAARADGSTEYSNDELAELAQQNYGADISNCVSDGTYRAFAEYTTNLASQNGISGTPTIFVDDTAVEQPMNVGEVILEAVGEYQEESGEQVLDEVEEDLGETAPEGESDQTEAEDESGTDDDGDQ
ncbi:thioredoxin domain-containing protein [Nesterenkonia sp.]|uniref:DsbA family protein n=1 Tax=Nesterenkonia sp. TaxID=704201 RepID=UPI002613BD74|nr:thioredoxin domain-containing protein [Nesterenkonia sp.]